MDIETLDTLVFAGGGVRGFSYVGVLMAFRDTYKKSPGKHFSTFAGTSVGSLFALLCCLDLDLSDAMKIFKDVGLENIFQKDPTCLLSSYALNSGSALESLVHSLLALGSLDSSTTLKQLYDRTKKKLVVAVIDLYTANMLYLDHLNIGCDMPVAKAIMGSMALPPLFPPVAYSKGRSRLLMTDGGLLETSPVALFDTSKALLVSSIWYIDNSTINDIAGYYSRIVHIMLLGTYDVQEKATRSYLSIDVDLGSISPDCTDIDVNQIIFLGYRAAIGRLTSKEYTRELYDPTKFIRDSATEALRPAFFSKL